MNLQRFDRLTASLARTRRVLAAFGHAPETPVARGGERLVLVLCAPHRFAAIAFALGRDVEPIGAMTATAALDFLGAREFDACVLDHASIGGEAPRFVEDMRRIGRHAGVPLVVLGLTPNEPFLLELGADTIVGPEALGLRVLPLAAAARTARLARTEMRVSRDVVIDPMPCGLSGPRLFAAHVTDVLLGGEDKSTAIVVVDVEGPAAAVTSAAGLIRTLTRAEDICCALSDHRVVVIAAGAEGAGMQILADRLVAVIESSMLLDPETGEAVRPRATALALPLAGFVSVDEVLDTLDRRISRRAA